MRRTALLLLGVLNALLCGHCVCGEVFTASSDLTSAFRLEQEVVHVLAAFAEQAEAKLDTIHRYLKEYESIVDEEAKNEDEFQQRVAGNPIHAYRLMKRLTVDWKNIENILKTDDWNEAVRHLEYVRMKAPFPSDEDFYGAAQALIRLQDTYELNITDLSRGKLSGSQTHAELTAQDCLFMGKHALNNGALARAVEWFEEAFALAGLESNQTINQNQVLEYLNNAVKMHDDIVDSAESDETKSHTVSFDRPLREESALSQRLDIINKRNYRLGKNISVIDDLNNFNALCRGENLLSEKIQSQMKCWYDDRDQPYLRLMPVKIEQHSNEPAVFTFHDIISDKEMEAVKLLAIPLFSRSMVQGQMGAMHQVSNVRTSKTAWLPENLDPLLKRLSRRIQLITGLETDQSKDAAELLQVANYGIGGHYSPHHDYLMKEKPEREVQMMPLREILMGDRIATFMFYLNDVERGGWTAFPRAGIAVPPIKGSAAFWWNLKRSGKPDEMTLHGACPVLLGFKWVSNKWIRETAQTFTRSCLLDANE